MAVILLIWYNSYLPMFDSSQDSASASSQSPMMNFGSVPSVRKRGRVTRSGASGYQNDENSGHINLMLQGNSNMSQESFIGSQFSQDMSDRINLMSFRGVGSQDDSVSYLCRQEDDSSSEQFVPFKKHLKEKESKGQSGHINAQEVETERQIRIGPPITNVFLQKPPTERSEKKISNPSALARQISIQAGQTFNGETHTHDRKSVNIWIAPFKERPRYMCDFDQEGILEDMYVCL